MEMNKEYIPYDLALELKEELLFNEACIYHYKRHSVDIDRHSSIPTFEMVTPLGKKHNELPTRVSAPLFRQVFRWFREKHMLRGDVGHADSNGSFKFTIWKWNFDNNVGQWERISNISSYSTYEETEIACLKKLIELCQVKVKI